MCEAIVDEPIHNMAEDMVLSKCVTFIYYDLIQKNFKFSGTETVCRRQTFIFTKEGKQY